ncbi:MAG: hypothetical protein U5K31_06905 [Balneolaceae bacterium]|nr:hypothetical protein [Balneolaceae bacterium]
MPLMSEAGMSNYEILVSGTRTVGAYFGQEDRFGTVTGGARADLLLVDGNPVEDLSRLRDLAGVMAGGDWMPADSMDARLQEIAGRNSVGKQ